MDLKDKDINGRPTPKNYPLHINLNALELWELTIKRYEKEIKERKTLVEQWRTAIYCFQQLCVTQKIPPFDPEGSMNSNSNNEALNNINKNALYVEDLINNMSKLLKDYDITINKKYNFDYIEDPPTKAIVCSRKMKSPIDFRTFSQIIINNFTFQKNGLGKIKKIKDPTLKIEIIDIGNGAFNIICYYYVTEAQVDVLTGYEPHKFKKWAKTWCNSKKEVY